MFINFLNLCMGDIDTVIRGKKQRQIGHVLCKPLAAEFFEIEIEDQPIWMIEVSIEENCHPRIHFKEKETAQEFYAYIVSLITSPQAPQCIGVDVLAHGAI